jgi:hypothetical protein
MCLNSCVQIPSALAMLREVIFVETARGSGRPGDERTTVHQYWSKEGVLLAEYDTKWEDPSWPASAARTAEMLRMAAGGLCAMPASAASADEVSRFPDIETEAR